MILERYFRNLDEAKAFAAEVKGSIQHSFRRGYFVEYHLETDEELDRLFGTQPNCNDGAGK